MARLIAPNGSTVNVSDEYAKRLLEQGYKTAESGKKSSPKKAASKKSDDES